MTTTLDNKRVPFLPVTAEEPGTDDAAWYALPYSVRWAPDIMQAYSFVHAAAEDMRTEDPDFAAYLSQRARDIISDDYEGGDAAAWVRGRFNHLNAQIGSFDPSSARLEIHYERYNEVINQMLSDVLNIQQQGDSQRASEFIEKYISWTPELHDRLAERLRNSSRYRFVMVRYKALANDQ